MYLDPVAAGGAAEKAGLRLGDVVTAVNGTKITSIEDSCAIPAGAKTITTADGKTCEMGPDETF